MNLPLFLIGHRRIETDRAHAENLLNLCMAESLSLSDFSVGEDGEIGFCLGLLAASRILRECRQLKIPLKTESGGLPLLLWRLRGRAGLLFGAVCAVFLFLLSQRFVWSVRVEGNERLTAGEIRRELAEQGLSVGSYVPTLQMGEIETRVLLRSDDLSWIAVHMDGTVAKVQVVERGTAPEKIDRPANLIAARDGQIEGLELYRGRAVVEIGQPVRAGELLVSGVYDSTTVGYRYTRASGRVLARTERVIEVEIPLVYEEKVYAKETKSQTTLNFFNFSLNFSKNSRNETPLCDIIETSTGNDWLGLHDLPVSLSKRTYRPYTVKTVERSPEQALEIAYEQLENELSEISGEVQPIAKHISTTITDTALILECRLDCVENIAVQTEFEVIE